MPSPFLYFPGGVLSRAELSAARLDGHVIELGEGYVPADLVETAFLRAASLAELLGDTLAATHESAAWVFGVLDDPPARHHVQRAVGRRLHHVLSRRLIYRDPRILPADLCDLGGVRVSAPGRTLADLARSAENSHHDLAVAWTRGDPGTALAALSWLEHHPGVPRKRMARMLLSGRQDDVTR